MVLILIVTFIVIVSLAFMGAAGSWIDASIERQEAAAHRKQDAEI